MDKRYCEVQEINGIRTVANIVVASEEVAKERNYIPAENLCIGDYEENGKWCRPEPVKEPLTGRDVIRALTEKEALALVDLLAVNKIISAEKAEGLKGK